MRRSITYLRVSLTSACNLRCSYCRPAGQGAKEPLALPFDGLVGFIRAAVACGVRKVRLTGGEPLLYPGIEDLIAEIAAIPGLKDLAMTTNASLLSPRAHALREGGLRRVNIGLPSLEPETYARTTGGEFADAWAGIVAAREAGLAPVKINVVVRRGENDAQIPSFIELARREEGLEVRFIEYMPFGDPPEADSLFVPASEIEAQLRSYGPLGFFPAEAGCSAVTYAPQGFRGRVGIIAPRSRPFCRDCPRVRLTAAGRLRACLIEGGEIDAGKALRPDITRAEVERLLVKVGAMKPIRHAGRFAGKIAEIGG